jgi:hypothetical protein
MHRSRNQQHRKSYLVRRPARLSYANVAATLALFFALTGTAAAAVTLARDSVGSEHIQADAVGSSEIQTDAVRSQEIRDESIALDDLTPGARTALDAPRIRVDNGEGNLLLPVSTCSDWDALLDCSNLMAVHLPAGRWLVQAKLAVWGNFAPLGNPCGLVVGDTTLIDQARFIGSSPEEYRRSDQVSLMAVVTTAPDADSTIVAARCYSNDYQDLAWGDGKLTAIEVKDEAQTE